MLEKQLKQLVRLNLKNAKVINQQHNEDTRAALIQSADNRTISINNRTRFRTLCGFPLPRLLNNAIVFGSLTF